MYTRIWMADGGKGWAVGLQELREMEREREGDMERKRESTSKKYDGALIKGEQSKLNIFIMIISNDEMLNKLRIIQCIHPKILC